MIKVILPYEAASAIQELFDDGTDKPQTAAKVADLSKLIAYLGRKGDTALKEIENDFSAQKENIKYLLNRNDLFNALCLKQNKTVGLSPERFRLLKYINESKD